MVKLVRAKIGVVAAFKCALQVKHMSKTRSGKALRGPVQKNLMMRPKNARSNR
ncbi:MAG: hypothetical protein ABJL99_14530 [Aliishimia sp.]